LLLPGISCGFALLAFPFFLIGLKKSGLGNPPPEAVVAVPFLVPLALSGILGVALAKFDALDSVGEIPIYIAIRPMSNGGFVMAKIVMALATSALTWLLTVLAVCFWLALLVPGTLFSKAGSATAYGPMAFVIGCMPLLLLLVIMTWKNLLSGIGAGLTGRPWLVTVYTLCKSVLLGGFFVVFTVANFLPNFKESLLHWLPAVLVLWLAAKIAVSTGAFAWGLRRNAITPGAVGWIIGGWSLCGGFVAGYAALICHAVNKSDLWISSALAGFLILPLADLAIAPLALAWNQHR